MGLDPVSWAAIAAATAATVGASVSAYAGIQQGNAQKKTLKAQQKLEDLRSQRETYAQIRASRKAQADVIASGAAQGVSDSSSVKGGASGAKALGFSNIGYIAKQGQIGKDITAARQSAVNAQGLATIGAGIADIGGTIFANKDVIGGLFSNKENGV